MTNPDDQASPSTQNLQDSLDRPYTLIYPGLTKREYFAAQALIGVQFWDAHVNEPCNSGGVEQIVKSAVLLADALIAELNK